MRLRPRTVALIAAIAALWIAAGATLAYLYLSRTPRVDIVAQGVADGETLTPADTIEARVGATYRIDYVLRARDDASRLPLDLVIALPPPGMIEPGASEPKRELRIPLGSSPVNEELNFGLRFTEPSDLVPGTWTLAFWSGEAKLGETSFTLSLP